MTEADLAKKLPAQPRHVTNPTPAKLLAAFRRLVVSDEAKPRPKHQEPCVAHSTRMTASGGIRWRGSARKD